MEIFHCRKYLFLLVSSNSDMEVPMRLRHIEIFRALMLTHSVTRAAEQLNTSQPTASRFLAEMEREIGFKLFTRTGGKLFPTPEADALYVEVQRSFSGLERIRQVATGIAEFRTDRLRISSISSFALGYLAKVVPAFSAKFPNVEVFVEAGGFDEVVRNVIANQCEIGFVAYPVDHRGVTQVPILKADALCAMPVGHRLAKKSELTPEDLRGEAFISLGHDVPSGRSTDRLFAEAGVERHIVLETRTAAIACAFIKEGMGLSILDPFTVTALLDERMVARPFRPGITFQFSALMRSDRPLARLASRFLDDVLGAPRTAINTRSLPASEPQVTRESPYPA
jgi:DNA-binding transcriptional LysR family regulator